MTARLACSCITSVLCRTVISINKVLVSKIIPSASQPPCSPHMSKCHFCLFSHLKMHFKGRHFGTYSNTENAVTDQLKLFTVSAFQHSCEESQNRLRRSSDAQENYFEGDKSKCNCYCLIK
ncbi:hypothetical protein AVEN_98699-1 [Araneus ventricosus]|uniref:Uncharacterized protein n=1 Tax=Araneus ventricosus TaxID=182803 RepID=A0A4Y2BYC8_ARAVE|nr:hypothetical protein AVEN_177156-1 [Araneus ventricosus]GBO03611.1 hypothetical protein AVEN_98699-1 [Araneus ventricosus]